MVKLICYIFILIVALKPIDSVGQWKEIGMEGGEKITCMTKFGNAVFAGTHNGIYRSNDNGDMWFPVYLDEGITGTIRSLGASETTILVGFDYNNSYFHLRFSEDTGKTWIETQGIDGDVYEYIPYGNKIYAATSYGLFLLDKPSKTWIDAAESFRDYAPNPDVRSMVVMDSLLIAGVYGVGIFISSDEGKNWRQVYRGLGNNYITSFTIFKNTIIAGTLGGVYCSQNRGEAWIPFNKGLENEVVDDFVSTTYGLFANTRSGIVYSMNINFTWVAISPTFDKDDVSSFLLTNSNELLVSAENIYKSSDHGKTWHLSNVGLSKKKISELFYNASSNKLFANGENHLYEIKEEEKAMVDLHKDGNFFRFRGSDIFATSDFNIYKYSEANKLWEIFHAFSLPDRIVSGANINSFYIIDEKFFASTEFFRVYRYVNYFRSIDNGSNWAEGESFEPINSIVNTGNKLLGLNGKVNISRDGGLSWESANDGLPAAVNSIALKDSMVIVSTDHDLYSSIIGDSISWSKIPTSIFSNKIITSLEVKDSLLFVGTSEGVFTSVDYSNWNNLGLSKPVYSLAMKSGKLYAGSLGRVYFLNLANPLTSINEIPDQTEFKVYPNPFSEKIRINFQKINSYMLSVIIYDILGMEIKKIEIQDSENTFLDVNMSDLPGGLYFLKIFNGDQELDNLKLIKQ